MMTNYQITLLLMCIHAVRYREQAILDDDEMRGRDTELVEVGWINGVNPRTAKSLVDIGLLVTEELHGNTHVRLPRLDELEESGIG